MGNSCEAGQFVTLWVCLGMWWRRSWFSLNGTLGFPGSEWGTLPYATRRSSTNNHFMHHADLHAHLALKEAALAKLKPYERGTQTRSRASDRLLAFLEAL